QCIEFRNLNVIGILVDCFSVRECSTAADVVSLICSAGGNGDDPSKRIVLAKLNSHSHIDERNTPFLQPLNHQAFTSALIDANENEAHLLQLVDGEFIDGAIVRDNFLPHARINPGEIIDFSLLLAQFIQRGRSGASKGVVVQENVVIKKVNLCD